MPLIPDASTVSVKPFFSDKKFSITTHRDEKNRITGWEVDAKYKKQKKKFDRGKKVTLKQAWLQVEKFLADLK